MAVPLRQSPLLEIAHLSVKFPSTVASSKRTYVHAGPVQSVPSMDPVQRLVTPPLTGSAIPQPASGCRFDALPVRDGRSAPR